MTVIITDIYRIELIWAKKKCQSLGSGITPGVVSLSTLSSGGDVMVKVVGERETRGSRAPSGFYSGEEL